MITIQSHAQRKSAHERGQNIIEAAKAAGREMTPGEFGEVREIIDAVKKFDADAANFGPTALDRMKQAAGTGGTEGREYLDLGSKSMVEQYVQKMGRSGGEKSLAATGDVTVGIPLVNSTPLELGRPANSLLQLLPVVQRASHYAILKQTTSTDAAAVVAPGALKPTSTMGLTKSENRLRVVATLSEPIDRFMLEDNGNLTTFVGTQLTGAVQSALEEQVLSGDGLGENFTGLANTSGIQTHTATQADRLVTLFEALALLESAGAAPSAIVLASDDWSAIATTRNSNGSFDVGGPIDAATRRIWGVPAVLSHRLAPSEAYVLGAGAVVLGRDAAGIRTDWGTPGDAFGKNQLVARTEGRFSMDVLDPLGVVKVDLTTV